MDSCYRLTSVHAADCKPEPREGGGGKKEEEERCVFVVTNEQQRGRYYGDCLIRVQHASLRLVA